MKKVVDGGVGWCMVFLTKENIMKNAAYAKDIIATMEVETNSKAARKRMAEMAVKVGNYDDEAKAVWAEYLKKF